VVLVSYSYPPVLGGSEIEAQRVCAGLRRRGYRIQVLCAAMPPMPDAAEFIDPGGVPVRIFGHGSVPPKLDRRFATGVARTLWKSRRDYDLVYFLMQGLHLATGLPVARFARKPVVMKFSGSSLITAMRDSFIGRMELRWLRDWVPRIMILNSGMEQEALSAGLRKEQLMWMPNPVDTDEFAPCASSSRQALRAQFGIAADAPVVIYVGRLAPEKELGSLLGGFAVAYKARPDAVLVLVGDGPERAAVEKRAAELGIAGAVRLAGQVPIPEVCLRLQAADVFALVSSNEGFPCSLTEAMSAGLPSVVSDIPANLQLIDYGVHGLHARMKDESSIGDALTRLFAGDALRVRMGAAARQRVIENYSMDKVLDRYESLFAEVVRRTPRSARALQDPPLRHDGAGHE
jgi:glycosyltransferase involved in cell wall biosynthesis